MLKGNYFVFNNFFLIDKESKNQIINKIFRSKFIYENSKKLEKPSLSNFLILEEDINLNNLYLKFSFLVNQIFHPVTNLTLKNKFWAHVSNKNYYTFLPHDHIKSSTIHGVYYLNIPKNMTSLSNEGAITFFINGKWEFYSPKENDLILMPNYLIHDTIHNNSKEYRISINLELFCDKPNHFWFN